MVQLKSIEKLSNKKINFLYRVRHKKFVIEILGRRKVLIEKNFVIFFFSLVFLFLLIKKVLKIHTKRLFVIKVKMYILASDLLGKRR